MAHLPPFLHTPSPPRHELLLDLGKVRWPKPGTIYWRGGVEGQTPFFLNSKPSAIGYDTHWPFVEREAFLFLRSPFSPLPSESRVVLVCIHAGPTRWSCYCDLGGKEDTGTQQEITVNSGAEGAGQWPDPCCRSLLLGVSGPPCPFCRTPPSSLSPALAWSMGEDLPASSLGHWSRGLFRVGPHVDDKCSASVGSSWPRPGQGGPDGQGQGPPQKQKPSTACSFLASFSFYGLGVRGSA